MELESRRMDSRLTQTARVLLVSIGVIALSLNLCAYSAFGADNDSISILDGPIEREDDDASAKEFFDEIRRANDEHTGLQRAEYQEKRKAIDAESMWVRPPSIRQYTSSATLPPPEVIKIDDLKIDENTLIEAFINTAFPRHIWFEERFPVWHTRAAITSRTGPDDIQFPEHGGLNKWRGQVRIAIKTLRGDKSIDREKYAPMIAHIKEVAGVYSKLTGLSISYLDEEFPLDAGANIYLILDAESEIQNAFKNARYPDGPSETDYERDLLGGVRFTPTSRSQVEGFFVPNQANEIEFATCYLKPRLVDSNALLKALAAECLTRALGLPEVSNLVHGSLVSEWNRRFDDVSVLAERDGFDRYKNLEDKWQMEFRKKLEEEEKSGGFPAMPTGLDMKLLRILYCEDIKPGMDKYEVITALVGSGVCMRE